MGYYDPALIHYFAESNKKLCVSSVMGFSNCFAASKAFLDFDIVSSNEGVLCF